MWIVLALQAVPSGGAPDANAPPVDLAELTILPRCTPSERPDEIVVCGRNYHRNSQRLEPLDPRFEKRRLPDGRFFRQLSGGAEIEGGGPKGSVGITLRTKF